MTKSNIKGGFFGKALAAACSVALVASLTPAAAMSAFAAQTADDVKYLTLKVQQLGSDGDVVRQATATIDYDQAKAYMSSASSASAIFKLNDNYGVATVTSAAATTVADLFEAVPAKKGDLLLDYSASYIAKQNPTVTVASGYDADASLKDLNVNPAFVQEVSFKWNELEIAKNFFPKTTADEIAWNTYEGTTGAFVVNNGETAMRMINQSVGSDPKGTTAAAVAETNMTEAANNIDNGFTFITGITENNAVNHNDAATRKMVQGVTNITVTFDYPGLQNTERIAGTNWDDTMVDTLDAAWGENYTGSTFVVATAGGYEDALAASGFAGKLNAPLLMTDRNTLTANTEKWIKDHKAAGPITIYLIGGNVAVSDEVQASLEAIKGVADTSDGAVIRLAGANSWDTALELYKFVKENKGGWDVAPVVATSLGFQDALSVSPYTFAKAAPVILTNNNAVLSDEVAAELQQDIKDNVISEATFVGGTVVVSTVVNNQLLNIPIQRYAGTTAYDTSNAIAKALYTKGDFAAASTSFNGNTEVSMATGELYLDALASCNYTGKKSEVLLLVNDTAENGTVTITDFLTNNGPNAPRPGTIDKAVIFGGTAVVSDGVQILADAALTEPLY